MKASWGKARIGAIAGLGAAVLVAALVILNMPQLVQAQLPQLSGYPPHAIFSGTQSGSPKAVHPTTSSHPAITVPGITSGTWVPLNHQPSFGPESMFVLTDGRIMAQDGKLTNIGWWTFKPDNTGSYINGNWTKENSPSNCPNGYPGQSASTTYSPLYYGSAVLPDGRLVVIGGEYNYNYTYPTGGSGGMV